MAFFAAASHAPMPKVTFVNEHRIVEAEKGRLISEVASDLGIEMCREEFRGTKIGGYTCWVQGEAGCVSPPGFIEKLLGGGRGWKRIANRTRILGDVVVWTQAGPNRLRSPRPVSAPPNPSTDPTAARKPVDATGTAAFPYGHPHAIGKGTREPIAAGALEAKAAKEKKAKAAAGKAAPVKKAAEAEAAEGAEAEEQE